MKDFKLLHDIVWSIPPKLKRPTQRKDVFWYHQPYLNIYDVLTDGGNQIQYVDLGLPSGILWADRNLGADSPEDLGDAYAWGETQTKNIFTWDNYLHGTANELTKYCDDSSKGLNGYTDTLSELELSDDAVYVNADGYLPNSDQVQELIDNTTQEWIVQNGVPGILFTGQNGNSIFIPLEEGESFLWASTLADDADYAYGLYLDNSDIERQTKERYLGENVRARGVISESDLNRRNYLTAVITASDENSVLIWKATTPALAKTIEYSKDGKEWTRITSTTEGVEIPVTTGDRVRLRGNNAYYGRGAKADTISTLRYSYLTSDANTRYDLVGNIMSLVNGGEYEGAYTINDMYAYTGLFSLSPGLVHATDLVLPATGLSDGCYQAMFMGCTNLVEGPKLPATVTSESCYESMFDGCASLTVAPKLPAPVIDIACYAYMFRGCTSLVTAPQLPGTSLPQACYHAMFDGCTNLVTGPSALNGPMIGNQALAFMFRNCTSLTNTPTIPATTICWAGCNAMFENCTSITTAPELYITATSGPVYGSFEQERGVLYAMFKGCTSLTTAPSNLPMIDTTNVNACYGKMFEGCTSLTTAPDILATTLSGESCKEMFKGCTSLNSVKCLATTMAEDATTDWLNNVAAQGTFTKDANATWESGESGIPSGWTVQDA